MPPDVAAAHVVRAVFGHAGLRPLQVQAVRALEAGRDVLLVLPTGGGKSLCYQAPAIHAARQGLGPTLVVSPLIALMEDQVRALKERGVRAEALHSGMAWADQRRILDDLASLDLVYASPERIASQRFRSRLRSAGVAYVAVDEAHCISEWGHDFRPEYGQLSVLREELGVPILAATATATQAVREDVARSLCLRDPVSVVGGFERENLIFAVQHMTGDAARTARIVEILRSGGWRGGRGPGRAIVYAITRKRTRQVYQALKAAGIAAGFYHAGRTDGARAAAAERFDSGKTPVLVATSAFGMGIDRPDVRAVLHVQAPGTLEAYYQQAGRAGRDGEPADCVLLFGPGDALTHRRLRGATPSPGAVDGWRAIEDYVFSADCRQRGLVRWFAGVAGAACGRCDACTDADTVAGDIGVARDRQRERRKARDDKRRREDAVVFSDLQLDTIVAFVAALKKPLGKRLVAQGLRGSRAKAVRRKGLGANPHFGELSAVPEAPLIRAIQGLLERGRLAPRGKKYPTVWIPDKRVRPKVSATRARSKPTGPEKELRNLRRRLARKGKLKPYQVFPDKTLKALLKERPQNRTQLEAVWGMGPRRADRYGAEILAIVARCESQASLPF